MRHYTGTLNIIIDGSYHGSLQPTKSLSSQACKVSCQGQHIKNNPYKPISSVAKMPRLSQPLSETRTPQISILSTGLVTAVEAAASC